MRASSGAAEGAGGKARVSPLGPFRYRKFSFVWTGGLVSIIGSWMQTVAVGALVVTDTGKALWAVLVAAGAFLPVGLLSPIGGALADNIPRRAAIVSGNLVAGLVALTIAWLVHGGHDAPGLLVLLVTIQGAVSALIGPFQQAILPDLVPREDFLAAASLASASWNLGRVAGPALAGITIAAFGYPMAFVANAVSFLAVVVAMAFVPLARPAGAGNKSSLGASLASGWRAARSQPSCWTAIWTIAVLAVLASPFIALVPAVAHRLERTHVALATAWLTTAQGVGAVAGALLLVPLASRYGRGRVLILSLFVLEPVLIGYGFAPNMMLAVTGMFVVGFVYILVLSGLNTVVQLQAPEEYRGRILGIYAVALGVAYPIGSLIQGPLADSIGLPATTAVTALVLLMIFSWLATRRQNWVKDLSTAFA